MNVVVRRAINHIECLKDKELLFVIDALVEIFKKRKAKKQHNPKG